MPDIGVPTRTGAGVRKPSRDETAGTGGGGGKRRAGYGDLGLGQESLAEGQSQMIGRERGGATDLARG